MGIFSRLRGGVSPVREGDIRELLGKLSIPELKGDPVSLGLVKKLELSSGEVQLHLELPATSAAAQRPLEVACEEALRNLKGLRKLDLQVSVQPAATSSQEAQAMQHPALAGVKHIIAIASGKGGVGKSSCTVNLAYALAERGYKLGILDADVYGPSIPRMTGVGKPSEMDGDLILPPSKGDIKIISAEMFAQQGQAQMLRGPLVAQIVRQLLTQVSWGDLDYLLIDYPPGTGDIQLTLSQVASLSGAVMVTTPQEIALLDVRKAIHMFQTLNVPVLGVIENMSYFVMEGSDQKHEIFPGGGGQRLTEEFGLSLLGQIPLDPKLAFCADKGESLFQAAKDSPSAKALLEVCDRLVLDQQKRLARDSEPQGLTQFRLEWK